VPRADGSPKADRRYGAGSHTAVAQRAARAAGLLRRIEQRRESRDRAAAAAEAPGAAPEDLERLRASARNAQQGLDVAVMMALADRKGPTEGQIAAAAGTDAYGLAHVRDRLGGGPPRRS
jgi:hypothetical protein